MRHGVALAAFLAAVLALLLVAMRPASWPLWAVLLPLGGPAALALLSTAPRWTPRSYLACAAAACGPMTLIGGVGLALRDSSGTTHPRLFLESILWNGSGLLFLGMTGVAIGSLPLALFRAPLWRMSALGQLRVLAAILATSLLVFLWLPATRNQGILVALVVVGLVGGTLAGSWWSLTILPITLLGSAWLWSLLHPPEFPAHEPPTQAQTLVIWAIGLGAVAAGAALGTFAALMIAASSARILPIHG